ncbi:Cell cycle checkpoint protein RAD1-like isoform X1 [Oopsacas minuta]|uniref:Cell cycle checkpoint protein RAD1-like isoform X1 n=1 Tax=Oopsacas minuta TaxID=111878 RepID=A0AAV7JEC5_9METZ|nr:Cell cycle checkpoint protein RAD1-like isoform X1 [Oopsacas minuta]
MKKHDNLKSSKEYKLGTDHFVEEPLLYVKMEHPKIFKRILKGIHFSEKCICFVSSRGLKFTNCLTNSSSSSCFIPKLMFEVFRLLPEEIYFQLNLTLLLEFLQIFGNSPNHLTLFINYRKHAPLMLVLEEHGVVIEGTISTQYPYETLDFAFEKESILCHFVLKPESLKDIISHLDMNNTILEIQLSPKEQLLRFLSKGALGHCQIDIHNNPDNFEKMKFYSPLQESSFVYKLSSLKNFSKALQYALKSSFRINNGGMLCIQFIINSEVNKVGFIEFLSVPLEANI